MITVITNAQEFGRASKDNPATHGILRPFSLCENGLYIAFDFQDKDKLRQKMFVPSDMKDTRLESDNMAEQVDVSFQVTGAPTSDMHGTKLIMGNPGKQLRFVRKKEEKTAKGKIVILQLHDDNHNLDVNSYYEFFDGVPVVRRWVSVTNKSKNKAGIQHLSSAMLHNFDQFGEQHAQDKMKVHYALNSWRREGQWRSEPFKDIGLTRMKNGKHHGHNFSPFSLTNIGTQSTAKYLPIGMVENTEINVIWFWQIEHNGSWHWETGVVSDWNNFVHYAYIGGPDEINHNAWKELNPGETYTTVPAALGCVQGSFDKAVQAMTQYRRKIIREHPDNKVCPVIFNDFMNCLFGEPTTEKEIPLINAAAKAGCDYFVIDAGWYAETNESWSGSTLGRWQQAKSRFPNGLEEVFTHITDLKMVPGIWLELESAGNKSPMNEKSKDWFFMAHDKVITDASRMQLDWRNPKVRAFAHETIDRMIKEYGAKYIKMDYNQNQRLGTHYKTESPGQGALAHHRQYLEWLDKVYERYPDIIIENCSSGGSRMDYALLSKHQIQSSSDQTDYRLYPAIVTGTMAAVLPEQLAVWSYPLSEGNADEASFNMVNTMLCRIHQSGHLAKLSEQSFKQVQTGISVYKDRIQKYIHEALPFFPLGTPEIGDQKTPVALGLEHEEKNFIAVWRLEGANHVTIPNKSGKPCKLIYPVDLGIKITNFNDRIILDFPRKYMGAIIEQIKKRTPKS